MGSLFQSLLKLLRLVFPVFFLCLSPTQADEPDASPTIVTVVLTSAESSGVRLSGKLIVEAQDGGLLLEDAAGRIHILNPTDFSDRADSGLPFVHLSDDALAAELLDNSGVNFAILQTEHFTLCSDASDLYTAYCGRLLEKVFEEYMEFFEESKLSVKVPQFRLPVLIFGDSARFQAFARQQHPETDFAHVPGYYSIRDNQMLIAAMAGERGFRTNSELIRGLRTNSRQVETIVHEAVHQLTFNTGLMVRYADNPMWVSEGLAVYFEGASGRSSTVWSRPGEASTMHLPRLKSNLRENSRAGLPLSELISSDAAFLSPGQLADAYGKAWALTHFLVSRKREGFDQLLLEVGQQKPLHPLSSEIRLKKFTEAMNGSPQEIEADLNRHIRRLRP